MNWSALSASGALETREQRRAALLEQALIKGSGLISKALDDDASSGKRGNMSLASSEHLSPDLQSARRAATVPERTKHISFEHIVRRRSPCGGGGQLNDASINAASPPISALPPLSRNLLSRTAQGLYSSDNQNWHDQQHLLSTEASSSENGMATPVPSHGSLLPSGAWQALAAAPDTYDRSAVSSMCHAF
ncbi:hypothetical protein MMC14_010813 [Varicellaria rhodocarpa]|nr:hypothetical protein [Varicellaria rhodocarpa]